MANDDAGRPNMVVFWKVVFPILVIVLLFFVLFITFSLPDWALSDTCSSSLVRVQRAIQSSQPTST
jgi:hypothetical protein